MDYTGAKFERTPEHAVTVGASDARPLTGSGLDVLVEANANWQGKRHLDNNSFLYFEF